MIEHEHVHEHSHGRPHVHGHVHDPEQTKKISNRLARAPSGTSNPSKRWWRTTVTAPRC